MCLWGLYKSIFISVHSLQDIITFRWDKKKNIFQFQSYKWHKPIFKNTACAVILKILFYLLSITILLSKHHPILRVWWLNVTSILYCVQAQPEHTTVDLCGLFSSMALMHPSCLALRKTYGWKHQWSLTIKWSRHSSALTLTSRLFICFY